MVLTQAGIAGIASLMSLVYWTAVNSFLFPAVLKLAIDEQIQSFWTPTATEINEVLEFQRIIGFSLCSIVFKNYMQME